MSNLLTPSESHAFQSFLSAMDYPDSNDMRNDSSEWSSNNGSSSNYVTDIPPVQQGREALAKATKDLMSLDAEGWNSASMMQQYPQQQYANFMSQQPSQYGYDIHNHPQNRPSLSHQQQQSHRNVSFPFLSKRPQHSAPPLTHSQSSPPHTLNGHAHVPQPISVSPLHAHTGPQDPRGGSNMHSFNSMGSPPTTSSSTTSTFSFGSNSSMHGASSTSTLPSPPPSASSQRESPGASSGKRGSDASSTFSPNKRPRPSPPSTSATTLPNKATLLSPSQKKANHIQSEQKRRANIRRGYEALCETVPALREAIRLEEEAQNNRDAGKTGKSKRGRRGKVDETTGEKIDGRAGPRSENIVLGKTIDYINDLLRDRQSLLERLERARSTLGPEHALPSDPQPLWEREWKGGSGKDDGEDEDEEEDED